MRDYEINETAHDLVLYSILFILSFLPSPFPCPLFFLPSFFFSYLCLSVPYIIIVLTCIIIIPNTSSFHP